MKYWKRINKSDRKRKARIYRMMNWEIEQAQKRFGDDPIGMLGFSANRTIDNCLQQTFKICFRKKTAREVLTI